VRFGQVPEVVVEEVLNRAMVKRKTTGVENNPSQTIDGLGNLKYRP
jgi:hypothetical protein